MKKRVFILFICVASILSACSNKKDNDRIVVTEHKFIDDNDIISEESDITIKEDEEVKEGETFSDPFVEGTLNYTIVDYKEYSSLQDANINMNDLVEPHNTYASQDIGEKYQKIDDFVNGEGEVNDENRLIILKIRISNIDAIGMTKKNEFNIYDIALRGGEQVSQFNVAYFSEYGKTDSEQPLHYNLKQGEDMEVRLGFFVLKEDISNLVGVISNSDVQFSIR